MFARQILRSSASVMAKSKCQFPKMTRSFSAAHGHGHDSHAPTAHDTDEYYISTRNHNAAASVYIEENVVIPGFVDTLEWVLDSPPNVHQFEEPPIVVEIDHLENLDINEEQYDV